MELRKIWTGRNDGEDILNRRLHQVIKYDDNFQPNSFVINGFAVDEGVRRNRGRIGARKGPDIIRSFLANFPVTQTQLELYDAGNIYCVDQDLETAQESLMRRVSDTIRQGCKSVVLGGGHELLWAHFNGLRTALPNQNIGIINIDAHFDNRPLPLGKSTSGTGFYQIAQIEPLNSLHIGIQRNSNTLALFDSAHQFNMEYILAEEVFYDNLPEIYQKVDLLVQRSDKLYLSVCMDVFNSSQAPGVSAPSFNGIFTDSTFMLLFRHILASSKLVAMDVAETNPDFDVDNRTARLAASLVNEWFMA